MLNESMYGQLSSESLAKDSQIARDIVKEINHFEISDRQRWLLIYNLSLELENVDEMKEMTTFIRNLKGNQIFITKIFAGDEKSDLEEMQ